MAAEEKCARNRQADCQRTTEVQITCQPREKRGLYFASGTWMPCISFTKKWWDSKWLPTGGCARQDESFVFFKIAEGYGGHPNINVITLSILL